MTWYSRPRNMHNHLAILVIYLILAPSLFVTDLALMCDVISLPDSIGQKLGVFEGLGRFELKNNLNYAWRITLLWTAWNFINEVRYRALVRRLLNCGWLQLLHCYTPQRKASSSEEWSICQPDTSFGYTTDWLNVKLHHITVAYECTYVQLYIQRASFGNSRNWRHKYDETFQKQSNGWERHSSYGSSTIYLVWIGSSTRHGICEDIDQKASPRSQYVRPSALLKIVMHVQLQTVQC